MYYPGMMPTADKRFYCTALGQAFNSFALKCFRNIWHWIVWPTEDKSVKPSGFVTRQHVSTHFWFLNPSLFLRLSLSLFHSPLSALNPTVKWDVYLMTYNLQFTVTELTCHTHTQKTSVYFYTYSRWISYLCVRTICDFMISFPASLSPHCFSLLAAGQKWAGREEGMAQKLLSSPSPCSSGVARWYTTQPFSCLAGEREGCGNAFLSHF